MQTQKPFEPPLIEARDLVLLTGLAGMAPIAWLVPQRLWPSLCLRLALATSPPAFAVGAATSSAT